MAALVRLIFGDGLRRDERGRFAAVLAHGERLGIGAGRLGDLLERHRGGIGGIAAAERRARARTTPGARADAARKRLRAAPALGIVSLGPVDEDFLLLMGRREKGGKVAVLGRAPGNAALVDRMLGRFIT